MTALKYTQARHIVLRLVESGDQVERYMANDTRGTWKYRDTRGVLGGAEARTLLTLEVERLIEYRTKSVPFNVHPPAAVVLSDTGRALLSEWNERYGEVQL